MLKWNDRPITRMIYNKHKYELFKMRSVASNCWPFVALTAYADDYTGLRALRSHIFILLAFIKM